MSKLRTGHIVEVAFWLILIAFFFAYTFEFDKEIEIYKYGAAMWPRAILLLMALAAIGQLLDQRRNGDASSSNTMAKAHEDSAQETDNTGPAWYVSTLILLAIPFIYMVIPEKVASLMSVTDIAPGEPGIGRVKIICAAGLFVLYLLFAWRNPVGAILALPIFFAALLEDMGFYALAPVFIIGVMLLMGERRIKRMAMVMPFLYGLLLLFFVKLLYVGLPTGNVRPFYDFGNWVVSLLQ
jgi:hypothetical protein